MRQDIMWIIGYLLFFVYFITVTGQDCESLARMGDCSFYRQCVESKISCGDTGYAIGYGDKYCNEFQNNRQCFSAGGIYWLDNARSCLMMEILNSAVYQYNGSYRGQCDELSEFAFDSHPKCYTDHAFCEEVLIRLENWECMHRVLFSTPGDLLMKKGIEQVFETLKICAQPLADSFLRNVDSWLLTVTGGLNQLLKTVKNLLGSCTSGIDLIVVMDSSGSIGSSDFRTAKSFVSNLVKSFLDGQNSTRVGVIRFATSASIQISLGSMLNANEIVTAINNITYTGGKTRTHLALDLVVEIFRNNSRSNQGIPQVAILLTDGRSNDMSLTVAAANRVHSANIQVYSFGIGSNTNSAELQTIASDASYVYHIDNFAPVSFAAELRPLQLTACTTPAISVISETVENTIAKDQSQYLQYDFPIEEGFTIQIDIIFGELIIYGSFSIRSPTSFTADFELQSESSINYYISPTLYNASVYTVPNTEPSRRKRQALNETTNNHNVYLTIVGVEDTNSFFLNTTQGDATDHSHAVALVGGMFTVLLTAVLGLVIAM